MTTDEAAWLASRPRAVQRLAAEFPKGTNFTIDGVRWYLVGYTEDDRLLLSQVDPARDHVRAAVTRSSFCAKHFRGGENGQRRHG